MVMFGAAFLFVGLAVLIVAIRNVRRVAESKRWPRTRGTVTDARIEHNRKSKGWRQYWPAITYSYSVRGTTFLSTAIQLVSHAAYSEAEATEVVEQYHAGKTVSVYYDPRDPKRSVLEPGVMGSAYGIVALGIAILFFGGIALYVAYS